MNTQTALNRTAPNQTELAVVSAVTLGYYTLRDAVANPWLRRAGQATVLIGGLVPLLVAERNGWSTDEKQRISAEWPRTTQNLRGLSAVKKVAGVVLASAAVILPVTATAWLVGRLDGAGERIIGGFGGRLPLVGGLFRRMPNTVNGALQVGVLYGVHVAEQYRGGKAR